MCRSCHLPIKDVSANQKLARRPTKRRIVGKWLWTRLLGAAFYAATVAWCAMQMPASLTFVVPGAVGGGFLHIVKGRPWLGLLLFLIIVVLVPIIFWPSMLTGAMGRLTDV